jgi:hypothetical protein
MGNATMPKPTQTPTLPSSAIDHMSSTAQEQVPDNVGANFGPPKELVVAFTDLNGNHTYDGANVDVLIAAIVDTNRDNAVSDGDTITFGDYPLNFDPQSTTDFGTLQAGDITIGPDIISVSDDQVSVTRLGDFHISWASPGAIPGSDIEFFFAQSVSANGTEVLLSDSITDTSQQDFLFADASAASTFTDPTTSIFQFGATANGDQGFVDIFIA